MSNDISIDAMETSSASVYEASATAVMYAASAVMLGTLLLWWRANTRAAADTC